MITYYYISWKSTHDNRRGSNIYKEIKAGDELMSMIDGKWKNASWTIEEMKYSVSYVFKFKKLTEEDAMLELL